MIQKEEDCRNLKLAELLLKEEIDLNNIFLTASLAFFFVILYAIIINEIELPTSFALILLAVMIVWGVIDLRRRTVNKIHEKFGKEK